MKYTHLLIIYLILIERHNNVRNYGLYEYNCLSNFAFCNMQNVLFKIFKSHVLIKKLDLNNILHGKNLKLIF